MTDYAVLSSMLIGNGNPVMVRRYLNGEPVDVGPTYGVRIDADGKITVTMGGRELSAEEIPQHISIKHVSNQGKTMRLLGGGHTCFTIDLGDFQYTASNRFYTIADQTQDEDPKIKLAEKQQRAAVQSKRHKKSTVHIQDKKDVPTFLQNFVNKAK